MEGCYKLRKFPDISTHIRVLSITRTSVEDLPASTRLFSRLDHLHLSYNRNLKDITHLPTCLTKLNLSSTEIEKIPESIKDLHQLEDLNLSGCKRLTSLPELPRSLRKLLAGDCESLETVCFPFNPQGRELRFTNCFKLDQQTQRAIFQRSFGNGATYYLPGREVPAGFEHRARGNSFTIRLDGNRPLHISFKLCLVISPFNQDQVPAVLCRHIVNGHLDYKHTEFFLGINGKFRKEHLLIFDSKFRYSYSGKVSSEVVFEFSSKCQNLDILECGAHILECGAHIQSSNESEPLDDETEEEDSTDEEICSSEEDDTEAEEDHTYEEICDSKEEDNLKCAKQRNRRSWLFSCFNFSRKTL